MKKMLGMLVLVAVAVTAAVPGGALAGKKKIENGEWPAFKSKDSPLPKIPFVNTGFDPKNNLTDEFFNAASTGDIFYLRGMLRYHPELVWAVSSKDGKTALHIACMVQKYDVAKLLLEYGADPNVRDYYCKTPYHYAWMVYDYKTCRLLRKYGAETRAFAFFPHCCTEPHPWREPGSFYPNPAYREGRDLCCEPPVDWAPPLER